MTKLSIEPIVIITPCSTEDKICLLASMYLGHNIKAIKLGRCQINQWLTTEKFPLLSFIKMTVFAKKKSHHLLFVNSHAAITKAISGYSFWPGSDRKVLKPSQEFVIPLLVVKCFAIIDFDDIISMKIRRSTNHKPIRLRLLVNDLEQNQNY